MPNIGELERRYVLEAVESGFVSSVGPFVSEFERRFAERRRVEARHRLRDRHGRDPHRPAPARGRGATTTSSAPTSPSSARSTRSPTAAPVRSSSTPRPARGTSTPPCSRPSSTGAPPRGRPSPRSSRSCTCSGSPPTWNRSWTPASDTAYPCSRTPRSRSVPTWTTGRYAGRHTGTVGRVGCFSFNGNKIATTGGGGMIVTDDDDAGRTGPSPHDPGQGARRRLPPRRGRLQLPAHQHRGGPRASPSSSGSTTSSRPSTASPRATTRRLADLPLVLPPRVEGLDATYWLYSVLVPESDGRGRDEFLDHLNGLGVGARALWRPLHAQPPFPSAPVDRWGGRRRPLRAWRLAALRHRADRRPTRTASSRRCAPSSPSPARLGDAPPGTHPPPRALDEPLDGPGSRRARGWGRMASWRSPSGCSRSRPPCSGGRGSPTGSTCRRRSCSSSSASSGPTSRSCPRWP